jgi:hypothetical protein
MRAPLIVVISVVLAAVALGWALRLHEPSAERMAPTGERAIPTEAAEEQDPVPQGRSVREPDQADATSRPTGNHVSSDDPINVADRARFNEQAREFFAQAPAMSPEEARRRAGLLSQELSRVEQAGGMSAGETFLLRVGLIEAAEPDELQRAAQIRALKERYAIDNRQRTAQAAEQVDPMFQLYKARESEIVAEVMSLQTIPDGLSREEYLRRRLQAAREQLLGGAM